jgi:hypothetical protein
MAGPIAGELQRVWATYGHAVARLGRVLVTWYQRLGLAIVAGLMFTATAFELGQMGCPEGWLLTGNVADDLDVPPPVELIQMWTGDPAAAWPRDLRCLRAVDHQVELMPARVVWR